MKTSLPKHFPYFLWISISFLLMLILSLRFTYEPVGGPSDGPSLYGYGFPLAWLRWDMTSSLHSVVSLPGLFINLTCALLITWFPFFRARPQKTQIYYALQGIGILGIASFCLLLFLASEFLHPTWSAPFDEGWTKIKTEVYLGVVGDQYGP